MEKKNQGLIAILVIVLVLVIDQASKIWVKTHMSLFESIEITSWFKIYFVENNGMAFGMEFIGKMFLSIFRIVAIGFIGYYLYKLINGEYKTGYIICISLILAAAQRFISSEERLYLTSEPLMEIFKLMETNDILLSIDLADGDAQVGEMKEIISEYPNLRIAIGHFAMVTRPKWQEQIKLAQNKNVMIESGGITWLFNDEFYPFKGAVKAIKEAADLVGMDKLMWGSDYPRTITAITYRMSYDFILKSKEIGEENKARFLGFNAEKFYRFKNLIDLPYIKNMSE